MELQKTSVKLVSYMSFQYGTLLLTLMMIIYSTSSFTNASSVGNVTDKLSLLEFKAYIDGPNEILRSWNESIHHCNWPGVTCGRRHKRVQILDLHGQMLSGSITPHIGNLSFLRYINLQDNIIQGEIPQEIGHLSRLRQLFLSGNTLVGTIPINLSYCKDLNALHLTGNNLTGEIPSEFGLFRKLRILSLSKNNLKEDIPRSIGNISSLTEISIAFNNLQGSIPDELGKLASLEFLQLSINNLSGIVPPSLYNISTINTFSIAGNQLTGNLPHDVGSGLPNLKEIYIGGNKFDGRIPASITNASKLQEVQMSANNFTGQVPNNIGLLSNLKYLNLEMNQLGGYPTKDLSFLESLSNCTRLEKLSVVSNNIGGRLPTSIANLSIHMTELRIGFNQISGPIPEALGSLVNLYGLAMHDNHLSGSIPSSFGRFQRLQLCYLFDNELSDRIPSSLGNMSELVELDLSGNKLEGHIPESIANCQNLQLLEFGYNNLSGMIPPRIFSIPSLLEVNITKNLLSGTLPSQVGKLKSMYRLLISRNNLSGEIPTSIGDCSSLEYIDMHGNSFEGSVPSTLSSLKGLQQLDLSQNNLSGNIPTNLGSLMYLNYLNLSFNDFEGEIPTTGVFANSSLISLVGNDKLCGGIAELERLPCPTTNMKKKNFSSANKLIITLACVVFSLTVVTVIGALCWRTKKSELPFASSGSRKIVRVSYGELYKATDGFSLDNLIGSGSFGSVYKGKIEHKEDKLVAVKVLNLLNSKASKSFMSECKILRNIRHRNLVKVLTYCSSIDFARNEFKALVYELIPQGNLDIWLHPDAANSSRTLTLLQRLNIAIDVASALQYLHTHCQAPIVHCDLKPNNILLDDDMSAHVGDFGLARFRPKVKIDVPEVSSIGIKGSVGYAAPEYGTGNEVSACGDIYSYGIILLEMMTGTRPTDEIFSNSLNLHNYVKRALPKQVHQILDPILGRDQQVEEIKEEELGEKNVVIVEIRECGGSIGSSYQGSKLEKCIVQILTIGLACSDETPTERMDIDGVIRELYRARERYTCVKKGR